MSTFERSEGPEIGGGSKPKSPIEIEIEKGMKVKNKIPLQYIENSPESIEVKDREGIKTKILEQTRREREKGLEDARSRHQNKLNAIRQAKGEIAAARALLLVAKQKLSAASFLQ